MKISWKLDFLIGLAFGILYYQTGNIHMVLASIAWLFFATAKLIISSIDDLWNWWKRRKHKPEITPSI